MAGSSALTCVYLLDPDEPHLTRARLSQASLRRYDPAARIVVLMPSASVTEEAAATLLPDADEVRVVSPLHATSGYFQDNCAHLGSVVADRLLYVDSDTIFFASATELAERYAWADVAAAGSAWVWQHGYRTSLAPDILTPVNGGVVLMSAAFRDAWTTRLPERHASLLIDPDRVPLVDWLRRRSATAYHRHELVLSEAVWSGSWRVAVLGEPDCYHLREMPDVEDSTRWTRTTVLHTYGHAWAGCVSALRGLPALADHPVAGVPLPAGTQPEPTPDLETRFNERWLYWTVEQLLANRRSADLVEVMTSRGLPKPFAERALRSIETTPAFQAARASHRPAAKLAEWTELAGELATRGLPAVERKATSAADFYAEHYFPSRPVVLTGLMADWPARTRWSLDYFADRFGDATIEISADRDADAAYEGSFEQHRTHVPLRDYVEMIRGGGATNDYYMVARNRVLEQPELRALNDDFSSPPGFLDPASPELPHVRLWLGPAGTVTPLHCDDRPVLFGQVLGRKRVRLVPTAYLRSVSNADRCFSQVDVDAIDLARFPRMRDVPVYDVELQPGELLFIPLGWWHWVKALDVSASLTFTNFYAGGPTPVWRSATL